MDKGGKRSRESSECGSYKRNEKKKKVKNKHIEMELNNVVQHDDKIEAVDICEVPVSNATGEILSWFTFDDIKGVVCDNTLKAISDMGFTRMTKIQLASLRPLLKREDLIGGAVTGSGKTLSFLVPAIELVYRKKFTPENGTGVIIISPTRELSLQTFGVLKELLKYHQITCGIVMGGTSRKKEVKMLSQGINILVATPGRLLDHLKNTPDFLYKNVKCLVIDEADRILEVGCEQDMKQILQILPSKRQTMLFSATQNKKILALSVLALKKDAVYLDVDDSKPTATVSGLEQGYIVCPSEKKLLLLLTILKMNRNKKVIVFFSSCYSVKFHLKMCNLLQMPVLCMHGREKQSKRSNTFIQFCKEQSGILLTTDVAARGLDIPNVDRIIQYDPPRKVQEYIHRVGRTARGEGNTGFGILLLRPEELDFLHHLKNARVELDDYDFNWSKVPEMQSQLEDMIQNNYDLRILGKKAYKAYIQTYSLHSLKTVFDVNTLDLTKVANSFGFKVPPIEGLIIPNKKLKKNEMNVCDN